MGNRVLLTPGKVEEIWAKLLMCYGQEWLLRWRGIEVDFVKAQMAETFGELSDHQIAWALDHLPERAPSLPKFRAIALEAHAPQGVQRLAGEDEDALHGRTMFLCTIGNRDEMTVVAPDEGAAQRWAQRFAHGEPVYVRALGSDESPALAKLAERDRLRAGLAQRDDGQQFQFDLDALLRRQGTAAEQRRDWARVIAARVERGEQVSSFVRRKAQQALKGFEREEWLETCRAQRAANPAPVPATMPEVRNDPWADGAWL